MVSFTKEQPKDGDTILHCGHLGLKFLRGREPEFLQYPAHWFKFAEPLRFERPDRTRGEAEWFAACEACFVRHGEKVANHVRGDGIWTGDEPAIEKVEN